MSADPKPVAGDTVPLCVDLDGTLLRSDTLVEGFLRLLKQAPWAALLVPFWLLSGRARLKTEIASRARLDVSLLPAHQELVEWLKTQRAANRPLVLCTAANARVARSVAEHFGLFDEVICSTDVENSKGRAKATRLVERFGERGFDYAGNDDADRHVWAAARRAIAVAPNRRLERYLRELPTLERIFPEREERAMSWLRAFRVHQWAKNTLIFVPAITSHTLFQADVLLASILAFVAFSLCASGTYVLNDLLDLDADRQHATKRHRPFASGALPLANGLLAAGGLTIGALVLALVALGPAFFGILLTYVLATLAYSAVLKRIAMVDVLTLAGLYALRVVAGGIATGIVLSFWLLAFSTFLFLSLALAKRYVELAQTAAAGRAAASGRGYTVQDLPLLQSLGASAGYVSVLVLALYLDNGAEVIYSRPQMLWLLCAVQLYWINRVWLKTARGQMDDDPVVWALKDRSSGVAAVLFVIAVVLAI